MKRQAKEEEQRVFSPHDRLTSIFLCEERERTRICREIQDSSGEEEGGRESRVAKRRIEIHVTWLSNSLSSRRDEQCVNRREEAGDEAGPLLSLSLFSVFVFLSLFLFLFVSPGEQRQASGGPSSSPDSSLIPLASQEDPCLYLYLSVFHGMQKTLKGKWMCINSCVSHTRMLFNKRKQNELLMIFHHESWVLMMHHLDFLSNPSFVRPVSLINCL